MRPLLFLLIFSMNIFTALAQDAKQLDINPPKTAHKRYEIAKNLAFKEQRPQAQDTLRALLKEFPEMHYVRAFLASTYTWDKKYLDAEKELNTVLSKKPKEKSAWIARIKNSQWGISTEKAKQHADEALKHFPNDEELLHLQAFVYGEKDKKEGLRLADNALKEHPESKKLINFREGVVGDLSVNSIGLSSAIDVYSQTFDPMRYHSISYGRKTDFGRIIARINYNNRFNTDGVQYELDMYPKISKGLYAYVSYGYSQSSIFPKHRYGFELFKSLAHSFEISLGLRGLKYNSITTLYTGSVSWYTGNNYWSFRTFLNPSDEGVISSGALTFRSYRKDANNYMSFTLGAGFFPEENRFSFGDTAVINLKSQQFNVGYHFSSKKDRNLWGVKAGVVHQEINFDQGNYFWIYQLSLNWRFKFK